MARRPIFSLAEWAPLDEAFARVKDALKSRSLAEHDLHQHLLSGGLPSAVRRVARDGTEVFEGLDPAFWAKLKLHEQMDFETPPRPTGQVQVDGLDREAIVHFRALYFFVRRKALDKLYPTGTAPGAHPSAEQPPVRRRGQPLKHEWLSICGEIARRCIDPSGRVRVPKSENRLAKDMLNWCAEQYDYEPAPSDMREAVKAVCAPLRTTIK